MGNSSKLSGKTVVIIGDSITEHNFRAKVNWGMYLESECGCTVQNLGLNGSGITTLKPDRYALRTDRIAKDCDIIGVAVSFNDLDSAIRRKLPIGEPTDTAEDTLLGCINVYFDELIAKFPTTPIICYIQNPWAENGAHKPYRYGEAFSDEFVSKAMELFALKGVPFYHGMYTKGSVLRPWIEENRRMYFTSDYEEEGNFGEVDTDHPNSRGHRVIYEYLKDKFEKNI